MPSNDTLCKYQCYIVFCLTRPGIEPTIHRSRGEPTNHNTTEAIMPNMIRKIKQLQQLGFILYHLVEGEKD
jgi:hypothetical protein